MVRSLCSYSKPHDSTGVQESRTIAWGELNRSLLRPHIAAKEFTAKCIYAEEQSLVETLKTPGWEYSVDSTEDEYSPIHLLQECNKLHSCKLWLKTKSNKNIVCASELLRRWGHSPFYIVSQHFKGILQTKIIADKKVTLLFCHHIHSILMCTLWS